MTMAPAAVPVASVRSPSRWCPSVVVSCTCSTARRYPHAVATGPDKLPIKMLNDRLLVRIPDKDGERRSSGGILIPATAQMAKRLVWAEVVALGSERARRRGRRQRPVQPRGPLRGRGAGLRLHHVARTRPARRRRLPHRGVHRPVSLRPHRGSITVFRVDTDVGDQGDVGESGSGTVPVIRILRTCPSAPGSTPVPNSSRP